MKNKHKLKNKGRINESTKPRGRPPGKKKAVSPS